MKRFIRAEREKSYKKELATYQSVITELIQGHREMSFMEKQAVFWMESARFLITELEVLARFGDDPKYEATAHKVQKTLERLSELITQLADDQQNHNDPNKEE